ncbi:MAG: Ig-like domain-containing protein [Clostridia bacterium]|nr:Ig-like domain-containing protein [Clostridia bacterium]
MKRTAVKLISILCTAAMIVTCLVPAFECMAVSYTIGIRDGDNNPVTDSVIQLAESKNTKCTVEYIDCSQPNGSEIVWETSNGMIASVDPDGTVRGRDSSRQALVQLWIDADVKSIRGAGPTLGEKAENIMKDLDVENMSTDDLVSAFAPVLSELSQSSQTELLSKLRQKLEAGYVDITARLLDYNSNELASAVVHVDVTKSTEALGNTLPNGTYITNKDSLPKVVAVGTSFKIQNVITPVRLGMTTTWSLSTDSLISLPSTYADITEDGVITFKKAGTVTVTASPEFELFISKIVDYITNGGDSASDYVAAWLIDVLGLNVSQSTVSTALTYIVKLGLKLAGVSKYVSAVTTGNTVLKFLSNALMKASTNDKVTFTIVDSLPLESFDISCSDSYTEGDREQLYITDITPGGALTGETHWSISDPSAASISEDGYLKILDAGGSSASKTVTVTAELNGISISKTFTINGSSSGASAIEVSGPTHIFPRETGVFTAVVYPLRESQTVQWGVKNDDGDIVFASENSPVSNKNLRISSAGTVYGISLGKTSIFVKASSGLTEEVPVSIGEAVTSISIEEAPAITYEVPIYNTYNETVKQLHAALTPELIADPTIIWSLKDAQNLTVTQDGQVSPKENKAAYGTVIATTADGGFTASVQVTFANFPVTGVTLSESSLNMKAGQSTQLTATVSPTGTLMGATVKTVSWDSTDTSVAAVAEDGTVYAIDKGTASIICTTTDGLKTAVCEITVETDKDNLRRMIALSEALDLSEIAAAPEDIEEFGSALIQAKQVEANNDVYQFSVDAAFDRLSSAYEKLQAIVTPQSVMITRDGEDAGEYTRNTVKLLEDYRDSSMQLGCVITPGDALVKSVTWSSSNDKVYVSQTGYVYPTENKAQYSQITVTVSDYRGFEITDSVYVAFVYKAVTGVTFESDVIDGIARETGEVKYTIEPKGVAGANAASIQDLMWSSSDESVVTVDPDGTLHFIAVGTATVTAVSYDGGASDSCTVNVMLNKTKLLEKINEAGAIDRTQYTNDSYQAMRESLVHALEVYNSSDTDQLEIDEATAELSMAIKALVSVRTISSVTIYIDGAAAGDYYTKTVTGDYTDSFIDLDYRLSPTDTTMGTVTFSSSSGDITVDENGICRPVYEKACNSLITIIAADYNGNLATDTINVIFTKKPARRVEITPYSYTAQNVNEGSKQFTAVVYSDNDELASDQNIRWETNSPILNITSSGLVSFLDCGTGYIRAYSNDENIYGECQIIIKGNKAALIEAINTVNAAELNPSDFTYATYSVFESAYDHAVTVKNEDLFTQSEIDAATAALLSAFEGLAALHGVDDLQITLGGAPAPDFNSVKVALTSSYKKASISFGYSISPANAEYRSIQWSSSDSSVSINGNGTASPSSNSACYAVITLTVTDYYGRQYKDSVYVSFANYPVTSVSLNTNQLNMTPGDTQQLSFTIEPKGTVGIGSASIKDVIWVSSNESAATVNNGVVTAVDSGIATISCMSVDGGKTAECTVYVTADKSALYSLIGDASRIDGADYTQESYAALQSAISDAMAVYNETYSTMAQVESARQMLAAAVSALVFKGADYSAVYAAIETVNALMPAKYTEESYSAVTAAVNAVDYTLDFTHQAEVDAMAANILSAVANLVLKETSRLVAKENTGVYVDYENHIVSGVAPGTKNVTSMLEATENGYVTFEQTENGAGTGSKIYVFNSSGERVDVFELVIYGDVDGDGWYDGRDAFIVSCIADKKISESKAGKAKMFAADADRNGEVDILDAELLQQAGLLLADIDQTADTDDLMETQSYIEYISLIDQSAPEESTQEPENSSKSSIFDIIISLALKLLDYIRQITALLK